MKNDPSKMEGFFYAVKTVSVFNLLANSRLYIYFTCGIAIGMALENHNIMNTIILFLAILLCAWFIFKSIDWFEKI